MAQTKEREIDTVKVLPLHGSDKLFDSIERAITFLKRYPINDSRGNKPFVRFEIDVRYTDGMQYQVRLTSRPDAVEFLANRLKGLL